MEKHPLRPRCRIRQKTIWVVFGITTACLLLQDGQHPRSTTLRQWTSPPLEGRGTVHRVSMLVPSGWQLTADSDFDLTWESPSREGRLTLKLRVPGYHSRGPLDRGYPENKMVFLDDKTVFLWRQSHPNPLLGFLQYENQDKSAFKTTHRAILTSLHLE